MEEIEFECQNCGAKTERDLLPGKHTILGTIPILNSRQDCCEAPDYTDSTGYKDSIGVKSFREFIPGMKA